MPYKDPAAQREYQRAWNAARRVERLKDERCVDCGSTSQLEVDHVDPQQKVDHRIWTWSEKRRTEELAKCVIRCRDCHSERHAAERRKEHGLAGYKRGYRCLECRRAKRESNERYRANLKQRQEAA